MPMLMKKIVLAAAASSMSGVYAGEEVSDGSAVNSETSETVVDVTAALRNRSRRGTLPYLGYSTAIAQLGTWASFYLGGEHIRERHAGAENFEIASEP